ncbi:sensor histidine kinase [Tenacibaculum sp. MAR_2009_124]|uniref:sensor histidine kinase n=1 Tax=Tenacibaculum sp. MAR_2009_124 TaxID=1250059 RepID=UPI0015A30DFA|nr:ATP-binding protein [Tenacibaculum sp. MAR_2009_124]
MSIGKSLDYNSNCDNFLKLLLKRKNLNACWILRLDQNNLITEYSIPFGDNNTKQEISTWAYDYLNAIDKYSLEEYNNLFDELSTISINNGILAIIRLDKSSFLFLYSIEKNLSHKDLNQLLPVISKFSITLEACKANENQNILLQRLEERNEELNNYAHIVSHDLKSPLRNMDALVTWLKEDHGKDFSEDASNYVDLVGENISRMESLISGILEYSTIGLKDFRNSFIDLNIILKDIVSHIYIPKHIHITLSKNFPTIKGDTYRLQQLFQNLMSNAVKYNDKEIGKIDVGFKKEGKTIVYYVKDNGKGIEEKYHTKIFNVFQKLESNKNSTGIGLSIVEKIINNYGGKIWLTSELKKGTTFFFTLSK